jgi:predicted alpha/beta-hydrolase family hydrolase
MALGQKEGVRRPPDREPVLLDCWRSVLATLREAGTAPSRTVIGGKSLGARMASLICDAEKVAGLVCLGFPFHPPGKSDLQRLARLRTVATPTLICQGERDTFGSREDVAGYDLPVNIRVYWLNDGDHGFKPRMASGRSEIQNWQESIETIVDFIRGLA